MSCCSARCCRRTRCSRRMRCARAPTCCSASAPRSRSIRSRALPSVTRGAGGAVAIVTKGPTPYDAEAEVRLDGDVVDELEALLRLLAARPLCRRRRNSALELAAALRSSSVTISAIVEHCSSSAQLCTTALHISVSCSSRAAAPVCRHRRCAAARPRSASTAARAWSAACHVHAPGRGRGARATAGPRWPAARRRPLRMPRQLLLRARACGAERGRDCARGQVIAPRSRRPSTSSSPLP